MPRRWAAVAPSTATGCFAVAAFRKAERLLVEWRDLLARPPPLRTPPQPALGRLQHLLDGVVRQLPPPGVGMVFSFAEFPFQLADLVLQGHNRGFLDVGRRPP